MNYLKLKGHLSFGMETYAKGLQLMVFDRNNVWVCHKVRLKTLKNFIRAEQGHLFKARLQLDKSADTISITVKGDVIGVVTVQDFDSYLDHELANI